ncbi:MAG: hypothetical protein Pars92KO_13480 [Parasphingorhabdus sp.]
MNVYIASFMLLLFNAVGVNPPAAAMATETAGNEVAAARELAVPADHDNATQGFIHSDTALALRSRGGGDTKADWPVLPVQSTNGDKLEHEEGAP